MLGAAIIPIITSLFGGTRLQASGPTGPMTAVYLMVVAQATAQFGDSPEKIFFDPHHDFGWDCFDCSWCRAARSVY